MESTDSRPDMVIGGYILLPKKVLVGRGLCVERCTQGDTICVGMWVRINSEGVLSVEWFTSSHLARWRRGLENSPKCKLVPFPVADSDFERSHSGSKDEKLTYDKGRKIAQTLEWCSES